MRNPHMRIPFWLAIAVAGSLAPLPAQLDSRLIVISQVYGGGGNQGATLRNDFVELFNRGAGPVDVAGWTIQYASASGSSWDRTVVTGTIQPGQYYLVQEAIGNAGTVSLPSPDASGGINLSAASGKVALVTNSTLLTGASPAGTNIADFVGYGATNFAEGSPAAGLSNTTAVLRRSGGCADSNNNQADFTTGSPNPRNSQSPRNPCTSIPAPQITNTGVTNAASFLSGPIAAGQIVTIFGSALGPPSLTTLQLAGDGQHVTKSLAGVRVLFDGVPSAMIYAGAQQLSAVVPYSVASRTSVDVQVEYNGQLSNRLTLPVAPAAPGLFTTDSSGRGPGAILNQNYSLNGPSNRAVRGSIVLLYATGEGQTVPPGDDGKITGTELPRPVQPVSVRIGGIEAEVLYGGAAPGLLSGVLQVNARIPESLQPGGEVPLVLKVGNFESQPGVTVSVATSALGDGTGPLIEERLDRLKRDPVVPPLPQIPHDEIGLPNDWLALISWNLQVGATSTTAGAPRPPMVSAALSKLFGGTYQILAAQEIPNAESAQLLRSLLPVGPAVWTGSFFDSMDSMDNGFWFRGVVALKDATLILTTGERDSSGRMVADSGLSLHPPEVGHFQVGDFDFTLITLHLTFADGDTVESVRELRRVLDYLDWYFGQPDHDPDVIVCGDFNIPSRLSGQQGRTGITLDAVFDQDARFQIGERRFVVTVHQPTSRSSAANGGIPVNNYDHCVLSADTMEEFIQARRISTNILTDHPEDPEVRLTSDHFPVVAFFRTKGEGVVPDLRGRIRP